LSRRIVRHKVVQHLS